MLKISTVLGKIKKRTSTKSWLMFWLVMIIVTIGYLSIQSLTSQTLTKEEYTLSKEGVSDDNKWSKVRDEGNGIFFLHPGEIKPVSANFLYSNFSIAQLKFKIRKGSSTGNILFKISKNGNSVSELIIKAGEKPKSLSLITKPGDQVTVTADKNGVTNSDWGDLRIKTIKHTELIKILLVTSIWILFLYLMFKKNQASVVIAFYCLFLMAIAAEKITFGNITPMNLFTYTALMLAFAVISALAHQQAAQQSKHKFAFIISSLIAILAYILPATFIIYSISFSIPLDQEALYAIFQTNLSEGVEFVGDYIPLKAISLFIGFISLILYVFWWHLKSRIIFVDKSVFGIVFILSISLLTFGIHDAKLPKLVYQSFQTYNAELDIFRKEQANRKANPSIIKAVKKEHSETYVVVLGESLNKQHMGIYGYPRDTTPNLKNLLNNEKLIKFEMAYANHTHTVPVLSLSLTEADQLGEKKFIDAFSIIEVFNKAGFQTTWLTNQNLLGAWDNKVSLIANRADKIIGINRSIGKTTKTQRHDGDLIAYLNRELKLKTDRNRIIFVHLMGNHGSYCARFPSDFQLFNDSLDSSDFGTKIASSDNNRQNAINCYDNSVLYNDNVVGQMLNEVRNVGGKTALIYMADHADDVLAGLGHHSSKFTFDMAQIPMLAWLSEEYMEAYSSKARLLESRLNTLFPNDRLYDTLLGLANIETPHYRAEFDFSSDKYSIDELEAVTLHGKRKYSEKDNHHFWQKKNALDLIDRELSNKYFPHRVNSRGKLLEIWATGFRSFEVDVLYNYKNDGLFYVGNNDGVMGLDLESFLNTINSKEVERVWFDFKNLNAANSVDALKELNRLDKKYSLKSKVILESGWTGSGFLQFQRAGWHTSYYLPTNKIINAIKESNNESLNELAKIVSEQVTSQGVSAVSFDHRLYPFVKDHLEAMIPDDLIYHVWMDPSIAAHNFFSKLEGNIIYKDERIKTFLSPFTSKFNL